MTISKHLNASAGFICSILLAACSQINNSSEPLKISLINETPYEVCEVYLSTEEDNEWGANRLGDSGTLSPNGTQMISLTPSEYDLLVKNCDGITVYSAAGISSDSSVIVGGEGTKPLLTNNQTPFEICYFYAMPKESEGWGGDLLGPVESILPGESRIFFLPPESIRARAEDCDHGIVQETNEISLDGQPVWTIGNE